MPEFTNLSADCFQVERLAPTDRILSAPTFHHNGYAVAAQPPIKYEEPPPPPAPPVQQYNWVEGEGFNVIEVEVDTVDRAGQIIYNRNMPDVGF